ncbi:MAG TPA: hypothetical protein VFU81_00095, partial [Thermomicrobiales bacterium]|nr:hypothetical protein [Thermomicrobiales bacterium]
VTWVEIALALIILLLLLALAVRAARHFYRRSRFQWGADWVGTNASTVAGAGASVSAAATFIAAGQPAASAQRARQSRPSRVGRRPTKAHSPRLAPARQDHGRDGISG